MATLQREREEEEEEIKEKIKEKEKDIAELEAEAEKLVEAITEETEKIKEKVKIRKQSKVKSTQVVQKPITKPKKIITKEKARIKEITEEDIIKNLIQTYKWAYKENLYPWMYFIPEKKKDKDSWEEEVDSWASEWSNFLFDWCKEFLQHIVDKFDLHTKRPFNALEDREKSLEIIMDYLAKDSKLAKWLNDEKTRLRVYWQSLEKWGDILYDWAFLVGEERLTLLDLREMGADISKGFESLPAKDLRDIIEILVENKRASWIDKRSFKFNFDI